MIDEFMISGIYFINNLESNLCEHLTCEKQKWKCIDQNHRERKTSQWFMYERWAHGVSSFFVKQNGAISCIKGCAKIKRD